MRPPSRIGSYEVTGQLGAGGAGAVFLARHPQLGYEVAIKVPLGGAATSERHRERFAREADALGKVRHPGLVDVVDRGLQRGQPWFAMRRVIGRDLSACLEEGVFDEPEALKLASQLADAIGAAHAVGVLHRDLKPDNVIRTEEGRYVVTDFGLAKDLEVERSVELSKTGASIGTPGFWAPEQAVGHPTSPATDVYGIGATVYASLTGVPPIEAESFLEAVLATKQQAPKSFSAHKIKAPRLEPIVRKCLEKDPAKRYPDLASLRDALDLASLSKVSSGPAPWLVVAVLGLALVGSSVLTGLLFMSGDEQASPVATTPATTLASLPPLPPRPSPLPEASPSDPRLQVSVATPPELAAEGRSLLDDGKTKEGMARLNEAWIRGDLGSGLLLADLHHEGRGIDPDRVVARDLYRRVADRGHGPAMIALARSLHLRNPAEARTWFRQAISAGEVAEGYLGLGDLGRLRARGERDLVEAREFYQRAAKEGERTERAEARYGLALTLLPAPSERAEGIRMLRRVALQSRHEQARLALAHILALSPDREERFESLRLLQEGADSGLGGCWAELGLLSQRGGEFIEQDPKVALSCYANAVKLGSVEGLVAMARAFPNDKEASKLLKRAVALEDPAAQLLLGRRELEAGRIQAGVSLIEEAAKAQSGKALSYLAEFYAEGRYVKADPARASSYLERAASAGDPVSCHNLALEYRLGKKRKRDLLRAERWYLRAANRGFHSSFVPLGDLLIERGATAEGIEWYRRGAQLGIPNCMLSLANLLVAGKLIERDLKRALQLFLGGAKLEDANCAHMAAMLLERGFGTPDKKKDLAKAAELYAQGGELGDARSMLAVAEILRDGRGVKADAKASAAWIDRAIKATTPPGQALYERATYYALGEGLPVDPIRAARLFERAAAAGHTEASYQFAFRLCKGEGTKQDLQAGVEIFLRLAAAGHEGASLNLGKCYAHGTGVPQDLAKARELFEVAAKSNTDPKLVKGAREALAALDAGRAPR